MDDGIDAKYEFNAPKYIDFTQGDVDEDADKWFDERSGDEGGIDLDMVPYYEEAMGSRGFEQTKLAISAALGGESNQDYQCQSGTGGETDSQKKIEHECKMDVDIKSEKIDPDVLNNIKQERRSIHPDSQMHAMNSNESCEVQSDVNNHGNASDMESTNSQKVTAANQSESSDHTSTSENETVEPDVQQTTRSMIDKSKRPKNLRTTWDSPGGRTLRRTASDKRAPVAAPARRTPTERKCQPQRKVRQSSVPDYVNNSDLKRKAGALDLDRPVVKRSKPEVKPMVVPETPSFVRKWKDQKQQKKGETTEDMELRIIKDLQKETRNRIKRSTQSRQQAMKSTGYRPVRSINPVTQPKEFQFATDTRVKDHQMQTRADASKPFENQLRSHPPSPPAKRKLTKPKPFHLSGKTEAAPVKKWESMATMQMKFQSKTPERFHTTSKVSKNEHEQKPFKPKLTDPKTPQLTTKSRSRPVTAVSKTELEEQEAEEMKKFQFKATEFDVRIVEKQGMFGVKKLKEIRGTSPKPFHFASDDRLNKRKQKEETSVEQTSDVPKANKRSMRSSASNSSITSISSEGLRCTEPKPFSFESRDKERQAKKEAKIQGILQEEKEMHQFHARPLPTLSPEALPAVPVKKPTNPEPFALSQGDAYHQKWEQQRQMEAEKEKEQRQFKAQSADVVKKEPFKPKAGLIPPTDITAFSLNTDTRAKEREKFEEWKAAQERQKEEMRMHQERLLQEQEEENARLQREQAIVKANPVRKYKPTEILPSTKPLTAAETPQFATNKRFSRI